MPLLVCLLVSLAPVSASGADTAALDAHEILRLRIVNDAGGEIAASADRGLTWQVLGHVVRYTTQVNRKGYTASKWVPPGHIAATAVNAIHVTVGLNEEDDRGIIFSLLPRQFAAPPLDVARGGFPLRASDPEPAEGPPAHYRSFLSPDSSIYTDIPAGEGIFGGGYAPFVGSPVYLAGAAGELMSLPDGYSPSQGDRLVIIVLRPDPYPLSVEFENREGGSVCLRWADGSRKQLGHVVRPVHGIGRFEGALYAGIGRIRANHAGVIDVSTSPVGALGAFQIIPVGHALSPEMNLAWERTQWMIVGPVAEESALWQGLVPLFYQHLRPDYLAGDVLSPSWESRLLSRFLVDVETGIGWAPMPVRRLAADPAAPLPEWADKALAEVGRVRILFPLNADRAAGPS